MSQARHAMGGPRCVSSLQYDSGMKSLVRVSLKEAESSSRAEFKVHRIKPGEVYRTKSTEGAQDGDDGKDDDDNGEEGLLRRRRKGEEPSSVGGIQEVGSREVYMEAKDPIKWFGILVPQTLRRSQQCFVQGMCVCVCVCARARARMHIYVICCFFIAGFAAINHSAELASAQMNVEVARRKYEELLSKKQLAMSQDRTQ